MSALTVAECTDLVTLCAECADDLEHCHGMLAVHADGTTHCLDEPGCALGASGHVWVGSCADLLAGCCS